MTILTPASLSQLSDHDLLADVQLAAQAERQATAPTPPVCTAPAPATDEQQRAANGGVPASFAPHRGPGRSIWRK